MNKRPIIRVGQYWMTKTLLMWMRQATTGHKYHGDIHPGDKFFINKVRRLYGLFYVDFISHAECGTLIINRRDLKNLTLLNEPIDFEYTCLGHIDPKSGQLFRLTIPTALYTVDGKQIGIPHGNTLLYLKSCPLVSWGSYKVKLHYVLSSLGPGYVFNECRVLRP